MLKRVILCPSAYYPSLGGVEELTSKLAQEYKKRGYSVIIMTLRSFDSKFKEIIDSIAVYRFFFFIPSKRVLSLIRFCLFFPIEMLRLYAITKKFNPDVIHVNCNGSNAFYMYILSRLTKKKVIDTLHGETIMDEHRIYQKFPFFPRTLKKILKQSGYVTACSQAILDDANKYFDIKKKSKVVYNAADLDEFKVKTEKICDKYIFATGRFTYNKGFDLLVKAFQKVLKKHKELRLYIGGDGKDKSAVEKYIKKNKLGNNIILLGRLNREDTVKYMKNCLFLVMPSRYEPFGIVALEALAAGKAVLATKYGGPPEFIHDGKVGYLFDPMNPSEFAKKIELMLKNYSRLEKNSLHYVKKFTLQKVADQYIKIYNKVIRL